METNVLLIGAGITGLTAGRTLHEQGKAVHLLDKGRGMGGRLATRWLGTPEDIRGRWDHGAQFVTLRSSDLKEKLESWGALDVLEDWIPSHSTPDIMRRRPRDGMNAFAKAVAGNVPVTRSIRIVKLSPTAKGWMATADSGETFEAPVCICTLPTPQLIDLIEASSLSLQDSIWETLRSVQYERTLTLLAELEAPANLPSPGYLRTESSGLLETLIDNQQKGISIAPTLTAHARPAFSLEWYDRDRETAASVLRAAVCECIDQPVKSVQIHGWKFAKAISRIPAPYLELTDGLYAAGDSYQAGDDSIPADHPPRIESAMLSGLAVAKAVIG
jgi:predicted NAD/FAD-dependent oxidoreductase